MGLIKQSVWKLFACEIWLFMCEVCVVLIKKCVKIICVRGIIIYVRCDIRCSKPEWTHLKIRRVVTTSDAANTGWAKIFLPPRYHLKASKWRGHKPAGEGALLRILKGLPGIQRVSKCGFLGFLRYNGHFYIRISSVIKWQGSMGSYIYSLFIRNLTNALALKVS